MREPIYVPIPEADYAVAAASLLRSMSTMKVEELVVYLLADWLEGSARAYQEGLRGARGLQWKSVFLPEGSVVRTIVRGEVYAGKVIGDELVYEGEAYSPAEFANHFGATGRNAWENLWILFPHTLQWRRADACRPRRPSRQKNKVE
jgi:hypothetical protein